jgi:hypothetical protein
MIVLIPPYILYRETTAVELAITKLNAAEETKSTTGFLSWAKSCPIPFTMMQGKLVR